MPETFLLSAWLVAQVAGFVLASYGLLRQSFSEISQKGGFGEGRYGEGPYGGGLNALQYRLVAFGILVRLLPGDKELTLTDRKRNAACAIAGVALLAAAMLLDIVGRFLGPA